MRVSAQPLEIMKMNKRDRKFDKINEFKSRFRSLSISQIKRRLSFGSLQKEASVALQEVLKEKSVQWYLVWYNKDPFDDHVGEIQIAEKSLVELRELFNLPLNDPMVDCFLVKSEHVDMIEKIIEVKISFDKYDYFIEAYE